MKKLTERLQNVVMNHRQFSDVVSSKDKDLYEWKTWNEVSDLPHRWASSKKRYFCDTCGEDIGVYKVETNFKGQTAIYHAATLRFECSCDPQLAEKFKLEESAKKEAEEKESKLKNIINTGIPSAFLNTDLNECSPKIKSYLPQVKNNTREKGLYLFGATGVGKTYSVCALAKSLAWSGEKVLFTTAQDLLQDIRTGFNDGRLEVDIFAKYFAVDHLIIDDLGKGKQTEWAAETMFHIVDKRYSSGKKLIVTTQYDDSTLIQRYTHENDKETAEALVRRLRDITEAVTLTKH